MVWVIIFLIVHIISVIGNILCDMWFFRDFDTEQKFLNWFEKFFGYFNKENIIYHIPICTTIIFFIVNLPFTLSYIIKYREW